MLLRSRATQWVIETKRSEEHTSELQSLTNLVCRLLLETKNVQSQTTTTPLIRIGIATPATLRRRLDDSLSASSTPGCPHPDAAVATVDTAVLLAADTRR